MDPSCLVSTVQAAAGIKVWGRLSRPTLGPLVPTEHGLSSAAYLSIDRPVSGLASVREEINIFYFF
uniref:Uncharacterized protein n=1 Tax=Takifugu rubripes TaxID=31033 RepID=A0A674MJZ0_TAKRU